MVTGSADKSVKIWTRDDTNDPFQLKHDLQGHSKSVLFAVSYWDQVNHRFITLSSGSNRTIRIWSDSTCLTDQTNNFYVFDGKIVARSASNLSNILLIMAGSDSKVHLQKLNSNNRLESICILEGHQEWIRSVDCIWLKDGAYLYAFRL